MQPHQPGSNSFLNTYLRISSQRLNVLTKEDEMLAELKKIREAVEKAPPAAPPKGLWNEFKDFLSQNTRSWLGCRFRLRLVSWYA